MKRLAAFTVLGMFLSAPAMAADLPVAPPAPAPMFNWTGFYAGVHGGYAWSDPADGWFAGGQIGFNYQAPGSAWVWGAELDGSFADISESASALGITARSEANHFGSLRLRGGTAYDRTLLYLTGGLAWLHNEVSVSGLGVSLSDSQTHWGWTIGAGVEQDVGGGWSWKLEYLYADFGSETYFSGIMPVSAGGDAHTVRLGLNYRFSY